MQELAASSQEVAISQESCCIVPIDVKNSVSEGSPIDVKNSESEHEPDDVVHTPTKSACKPDEGQDRSKKTVKST